MDVPAPGECPGPSMRVPALADRPGLKARAQRTKPTERAKLHRWHPIGVTIADNERAFAERPGHQPQ